MGREEYKLSGGKICHCVFATKDSILRVLDRLLIKTLRFSRMMVEVEVEGRRGLFCLEECDQEVFLMTEA